MVSEIDTHSLALNCAEALIRIRHPTWGVVPPAYFIPDDGDPHLSALSEFVISRAVDDWRYFVAQYGRIEIAINLPIAFLQDPESVKSLCQQIPDHPAFEGLTIEITGNESKIGKFLMLMEPFGIIDLTRTGKVALARKQ